MPDGPTIVKPPIGPQMIVLPGGRRAETSRYDEAEFLVGGRGVGKGEIDSVTFKMYEGYIAEAEKWIKSRVFPYKTMTDLIRHAVIRHLRYFLPSMEGEVEKSLLNELAQVDEIVSRWAFQNIFVKHIDNIAEQVNATLAMPNGKQEAGRMLARIKEKIDETRYSYHKGVYEKMFMDRFGALLPTVPQLLTFDASEGGHAEPDVELPTELMQVPDDDGEDDAG